MMHVHLEAAHLITLLEHVGLRMHGGLDGLEGHRE